MAMVGVDSGSLYRRTHSLSRLAWSWVGGCLAPFYIHQMNRVNSRNGSAMMTAPQTLSWILYYYFLTLGRYIIIIVITQQKQTDYGDDVLAHKVQWRSDLWHERTVPADDTLSAFSAISKLYFVPRLQWVVTLADSVQAPSYRNNHNLLSMCHE